MQKNILKAAHRYQKFSKINGVGNGSSIGLVCGFSKQILIIWVGPEFLFLIPFNTHEYSFGCKSCRFTSFFDKCCLQQSKNTGYNYSYYEYFKYSTSGYTFAF